jgi:hypothetical protein
MALMRPVVKKKEKRKTPVNQHAPLRSVTGPVSRRKRSLGGQLPVFSRIDLFGVLITIHELRRAVGDIRLILTSIA